MKSSSTSERLKQIMDERSLRQVDILEAAKPFCEKYGVKLAKNDLSQYVSGKVEPRQEKLTILGLALNVSETWLMGYDVRRERDETEKAPMPNDIGEENILRMYRSLSTEEKGAWYAYALTLKEMQKEGE